MKTIRLKFLIGAGLGLSLTCISAFADSPAAQTFSLNQAVSESALGNQRGMFSPGVDIGELMNATSTGNSVYSSFTGTNNMGADAFSNVSGIVNVIQNVGNNVTIQNAVIVNLNLQ